MQHILLKKCSLILGLWLILTGLVSCKEEKVSFRDDMQLSFSKTEVHFDTVFTEAGSATQCVMVYNNNKNALIISDVNLAGKYFHINLDGENQLNKLKDIQLNGGDSLYMFVRVHINPQDKNNPVLVTDTIRFTVNGNVQTVVLDAYGQDVIRIRSKEGRSEWKSFTGEKPYLIYDTIIAQGNLTIEKGATLYMHNNASIYCYGNVTMSGDKEAPICIMGDRLDRLFDSVPYRVASGQWGGIFLINEGKFGKPRYKINHTEIISGDIGLYCYSAYPSNRGVLTISNSRIHNQAIYGAILQNTDAEISNTEISNCAGYCLYLSGGKIKLVHNTIASYFGWPNSDLNIHTVGREDVAAVYINNLDKDQIETTVNIYNCIIAGVRDNNLLMATPLPHYYTGEIKGCYIKADSIHRPWCHDNVYAQKQDTIFKNIYYKHKEYHYYDFRLDSVSKARGIGDSLVAVDYPEDRNGISRQGKKPDAGCYQYE